MQVIPSVNCQVKDFECVSSKVREAEEIGADWVHLDVADGRFTHNKSWNEPARWAKLKTKLKLEVHLMAEDAEELAHEWLVSDAKRIIVHAEAINARSAGRILELAKKFGAEAMLATNPETPLGRLSALIPKFREHLVLMVYPGPAGQKLLPRTFQKIVALRRMFPDVIIEVDGGMNAETTLTAKKYGADIVVAATAIFGAEDSKVAYEKLKNI